ncbi:MAG: transposase [Deltaproteobacteria bacterium]|nr:transposase [Deltaproteobacteria bacterium]
MVEFYFGLGSNNPNLKEDMERAWPETFRTIILPALPMELVSKLYCSNNGRPTHDLRVMTGLVVLQELFDMTDSQILASLESNVLFQRALNIGDNADARVRIALRTYIDFRHKLMNNDLSESIFNSVTAHLVKIFPVDLSQQRLDNFHLESNLKIHGQLSLCTRTIDIFLINLKKSQPSSFDLIDPSLAEKYFGQTRPGYGCFGKVGPKNRHSLWRSIGQDMWSLFRLFEADPIVSKMPSFGLLGMVLKEQFQLILVDELGSNETLQKLDRQMILSSSLQNPSDPADLSDSEENFLGNDGSGYQIRIMETYHQVKEANDQTMSLNLVTHVKVKRAHERDAHALAPAIDELISLALAPESITADSAYGGEENYQYAASKGMELIAPVPGFRAKEKAKRYANQSVGSAAEPAASEAKEPSGQFVGPERSEEDAQLATQNCEGQLDLSDISDDAVGINKRSGGHTDRQLRTDRRRAEEKTESFPDKYRWRSGVEETIHSALTRKSRIQQLRARGLKAVKAKVVLKVLALNINIVTAYLSQKWKNDMNK